MIEKTEPVKSRGRFFSLRLKIWLGFTLIFIPIFIGSYIWFYNYTRDRVFQTITDDLSQSIHGTLAGMDVEGFAQLYAEESANNPLCPPKKPTEDTPKEENGYYPEDNPLYIAHENWLRTVQLIELKEDPHGDPSKETIRLYTYIKGPDAGEIIAIGSTGYFREPRGGFRFCQRYTSTSSRIYEGLSHRVDAWTPYTDDYGSWITTYAPIIDANGNTVGALGIDIQSSYVDKITAEILQQGLIAFAITFAIIFLLVYWLAGFLTRPIIGLAGAAKKIGEGDYDQKINSAKNNVKDEIDTLTDVFKVMVDKVAQREQNLRARVQQLEIMIDKSKLSKQVSEIVESEFFQDLQSKVKDMRSRFTKGE